MLYPYMQFLPAFASDVLDIGASGLGLLIASIGMGALVGSLLAGRLGCTRRKGLLMLGACLAIGLLVVVFAQSRWVWLSMLSLFGAGAGGGILQVVSLTTAQTLAPDRYRGRIGSIDMTIWGLMPLGTVPIGLIAGATGVGTGVAIWAGLGALIALALGAFLPALRRLEC
jgi:MFS family permease